MNNIFNPIYRQDYLEGYSLGLDPSIKVEAMEYSDGFNAGFNSGRFDYQNMNGNINDGVPKRIVTKEVLEDFLLSGLLGLNVDTENYTPFQLSVLAKWYQSGTEKYDPNQSMYLIEILQKNGIQLKNETFYL